MGFEFKDGEYVEITTRHGYKIRGKVIDFSKTHLYIENYDETITMMKKNVISMCRKGTKEQIGNCIKKGLFPMVDYKIKVKEKKNAKKNS